MVVADDHRGGVVRQRAPGDLARMHFGAVDGAAEQLLEGERAVASVEEQRGEDLLRLVAQAPGEVAAGGARVGERLAALQPGGEVAAAEFHHRGQGAGAGGTEPGQLRQRGRWPFEQGAQGTMGGEQLARGRDRIAAAQAGAEQQNQQFGIGQRRGAACEQLLAGALLGGPFADMHGIARLVCPGAPLQRARTAAAVGPCRGFG